MSSWASEKLGNSPAPRMQQHPAASRNLLAPPSATSQRQRQAAQMQRHATRVRASILEWHQRRQLAALSSSSSRRHLLVGGASSGSTTINQQQQKQPSNTTTSSSGAAPTSHSSRLPTLYVIDSHLVRLGYRSDSST